VLPQYVAVQLVGSACFFEGGFVIDVDLEFLRFGYCFVRLRSSENAMPRQPNDVVPVNRVPLVSKVAATVKKHRGLEKDSREEKVMDTLEPSMLPVNEPFADSASCVHVPVNDEPDCEIVA
jgi:hypothetical protein